MRPTMHLSLKSFEGPLDLLLYLIKIQEINVFNIPIIHITQQYLEYVKNIHLMRFDEVGEYLAMAAQLIEIKTKLLLPMLQNRLNQEAQSVEELDDEDPRKPLVTKLIEFEALKEAALWLELKVQEGKEYFLSGECKRRQEEFDTFPAPIKGDVYNLAIALERVLLKFAEQQVKPTVKIKAQKITIHKKMFWLKERFKKIACCMLIELFSDCESRYELIVTIMALLELCKIGQIEFEQQELFTPIRLWRGNCFEQNLTL